MESKSDVIGAYIELEGSYRWQVVIKSKVVYNGEWAEKEMSLYGDLERDILDL